jgi:anion-transporting  ArsA/GET3 family ATPase
VILDSPATGHGLEMLRVPRVLLDVAPPGMLRREAERAWELFSDPKRAGALLVTLPEDMPVSESVELHAALRNELGLPVAGLVVNGLIPRLFDEREGNWLIEAARHTAPNDLIATLLQAGRRRTLRERVQRDALARLDRELPLPRYQLPLLLTADLTRKEMGELAASF